MLKKLQNLIRQARISATSADDQQFPVQQVEYLGKVADSIISFSYGVHGNIPKDTLVLIGTVQGDASNRVVLGVVPTDRPKMAPGETCVYHPPTGTIIHFLEDGDLNVKSAVKVTVDAPEAVFTGNVQIDGNLTVTGDTTLSDTVTSNGKDISDTHSHAGSPTAPTGGISNTGVPI